jgi:hypothetical protein
MDQSDLLQRLSNLPLDPNPALREHAKERAESVQNRIGDQITAFAGSMSCGLLNIVLTPEVVDYLSLTDVCASHAAPRRTEDGP